VARAAGVADDGVLAAERAADHTVRVRAVVPVPHASELPAHVDRSAVWRGVLTPAFLHDHALGILRTSVVTHVHAHLRGWARRQARGYRVRVAGRLATRDE
jgi:hypothetical protein